MKPAVRIAALAVGVAAVLGVRAWRENEHGKQVWKSATDPLDTSTGGMAEKSDTSGTHN